MAIFNYSSCSYRHLLFALDRQSAYSKLKPGKKAEALDLLQAVAKKGYGKPFLELANHGVPLAEKGKVAGLEPPGA